MKRGQRLCCKRYGLSSLEGKPGEKNGQSFRPGRCDFDYAGAFWPEHPAVRPASPKSRQPK